MSEWYECPSNLARVARALNNVSTIVEMLGSPWNWEMEFAQLVACPECRAAVGEPCRGIDDGRRMINPHSTRTEDALGGGA